MIDVKLNRITKNKFFIAIIPPPPLIDQAHELKNYFENYYQSKGALNAPPHITLHMPFEWRSDWEEDLVKSLQIHSATLPEIQVEFKGFGSFAPRVIFIQVIPSENLEAMQSSIRKFCKSELRLFNADYKDLPFHPHLTVAFRDLKKPMFLKAWAEFKDKGFNGMFLANRISLLKHDGKKWNLFKEFPLKRTS